MLWAIIGAAISAFSNLMSSGAKNASLDAASKALQDAAEEQYISSVTRLTEATRQQRIGLEQTSQAIDRQGLLEESSLVASFSDTGVRGATREDVLADVAVQVDMNQQALIGTSELMDIGTEYMADDLYSQYLNTITKAEQILSGQSSGLSRILSGATSGSRGGLSGLNLSIGLDRLNE